MKKLALTTLMTTVLASVSFVGLAGQTVKVVAEDDSKLSQLCAAAAQGNRAQFHNSIKNSGFSKQFIAENVQCNAMPITEFIAAHGKNADAQLNVLPELKTSVTIIDIAMAKPAK